MQNKLSVPARRMGGLGLLTVTIAAIGGCVSTTPPVVITQASPPPAVVYQTPPAQPVTPAQAAPVQTVPVAPAQPVTPVQRQHPARQLSDGQIVGVLTQANNAELYEAELALRISHNPRVRDFARQMIRDHSHLNNRLLSLADELGITPTRSAASQNLARTAQQSRRSLAALMGRRFDVAYIRHQVATHRILLNGINRILLPNARHPQLRATLIQIRPELGDHLEHARNLLMSL